MGLKPKIIRTEVGNCCDWCKSVVGKYEYPNVPEDIYKRHRYCRCKVEYYPGDGRRQDIYTKKWINPDKYDKIKKKIESDFYASEDGKIFTKELRKYIGVSQYTNLIKKYENEESRKFIRTSYRKKAVVGDGSTWAIRKMEKETGLNLGRNNRNHSNKVKDLINQIQKSLKKNIPKKDKFFLTKELKRLIEVNDEI